MDVSALLFICVALVLIAATILAMIRMGFSRLDSSMGILGDGLPAGKLAQSWSLPDLQRIVHSTPSHDRWQFLIFVGSPLANFPLIIDGMHTLSSESNLQVLLLAPETPEICGAMVRALGLRVPVVPVPKNLLDRYRIRVTPFGALLDPAGTIHWMGLANTDMQMKFVWQMASNLDHQLDTVRR